MNKVQVTLIEVNPLTREQLGEHEVVIDVDEYGSGDLPEFFQESMEDFRKDAGKAFASRFVDYDSFGSDSAYLDRLDQILDTLYLSDICVPNAVNRVYDMEGIYPDKGGIWGDTESGSCLGEAKFRALVTMSVNDGYSINDLIKEGVSPEEAVEQLDDYMDAQELTGMCMLARPDVHEAEKLIRNLIELAQDVSETSGRELRAAIIERGGEFIRLRNEKIVDGIAELPPQPEGAPAAAM